VAGVEEGGSRTTLGEEEKTVVLAGPNNQYNEFSKESKIRE